MQLSKNTIDTLVDLVENKLAVIQIGDRDDLREVITLQHCLDELRGVDCVEAREYRGLEEIPRRGRRCKISSIMRNLHIDSDRRRA